MESGNEGIIFVRFAGDVVTQSAGRLTQARRVVVENLLLDCNWNNQRAFSDIGAPGTFKMFGVNATASTGRFRNVIVRNLGSHGVVPASRFDNRAGTEAFPLMVNAVDEGQVPTADCTNCDLQLIQYASYSDPRPWLIEGCEIHGFNHVWAGYNTAIMVNAVNRLATAPYQEDWINHHVDPAFFNDPQRRFALVRNCQVRGGSYAFGQAGQGWCTGSTFTGNASVGAAGGYNADTHAVVAGDITNSVILDAHVGVRQVTEGFLTPASINHHTVAGNLMRIGSRETYRRYQDYRIIGSSTAPTEFQSDGALVLGYNFTNTVSCYHINGTTLSPVFRDNWITTRAKDRFYKPNPADLNSAVFRPLWCQAPAEVFFPYESGTIQRPDSQNVTLSNNRVSTESDNFKGMDNASTLIANQGTYATFNSNTVPTYTANRSAIDANPAFVSRGTIERVLMFREQTINTAYVWKRLTESGTVETVTRNVSGEPMLTAVGEIQIAEPVRAISDETGLEELVIVVKLVKHHLPVSTTVGSADPALQSPIRVVVSGINSTTVNTTSVGGGLATIRVSLVDPSAHGTDTITAYWNPTITGNNWGDPSTYEYGSAIATITYRHNTVVDLSVSPDVANDRNTTFAAQRPVFTIRRSGPTTGALAVNLELPPYLIPRFGASGPPSNVDVSGAYGATSGTDYVLKQGANTIVVSGAARTFSVTIPAGSSEASFTLHPTYDDLTEEEVAYVRVTSGTGYAVGPQSSALATIYDGAEWVLKEISASGSYNGISYAKGINNDPSPAVAGAIYNYGTPTTGYRGGRWISPNFNTYFTEMSSMYYPGYTPEPNSVCDTFGGYAWYCGKRWDGSKTLAWRGYPGSITFLSPLTANKSAEALAIALNPTVTRLIAGWSEKTVGGTTVKLPVYWTGNSTTPNSLGDFDGGESLAGTVRQINADGLLVGVSAKNISGVTTERAFTVLYDEAPLGSINELLPLQRSSTPIPPAADNLAASDAYAVNDVSRSGGVSRHYVEGNWRSIPTWWTPQREANVLKKRGSDSQGDITAISVQVNNDYWYYGRLWTNSVNNAVAVFWPGSSTSVEPIDILDQHFVQGTSGWVARRVNGINNQRWIVVDGTYNGNSRAFVLVRRL